MNTTIYKGMISFIQHAKKTAVIDYTDGSRKKTVSFRIDELVEDSNKKNKKPHKYRVGDEVSFSVKLSDRGDKMVACQVKFLYNTALEKIVQQARTDNSFTGYLKIVDGDYYVKEIDSYLFFPLVISRWEKAPPESSFNEATRFRLLNPEKQGNISAALIRQEFIPEYKKARHHLDSKTPIDAIITRVSPYAVYLNLFDDKVQTKLDLPKDGNETFTEGGHLKVIINFLSDSRIVVERAGQ